MTMPAIQVPRSRGMSCSTVTSPSPRTWSSEAPSANGHTASPHGACDYVERPTRCASAHSRGRRRDAVPIKGRSGAHWNYTHGHVPTESDQPVNAYATGSRDDARRGVLADDEWDIPFEGTYPLPEAQRAAARR